MQLIWIDDDPSRKADSNTLERTIGVSIKFENVKDKNLNAVLTQIMQEKLPDMIMIDHKLEDADSGIFNTGSTVAETIREKWPECPIVCITGAKKSEVDSRKLSLYEEVFEINKISKYGDAILSIAKSYNKIKKDRPKNADDVVKLLKTPGEDRDRLKSIMPHEVKVNFEDRGLLPILSQWTRKTLLGRPGFLYDRLWIATLLGVTKDGFKKIENLFTTAKYSGIFQNELQERWWKSRVLTILSRQIEQRGLPWQKGRMLPGLDKRDYSKCHASGEDFPETVAFTDQTSTAKLAPMKLKHTTAHPDYTEMLFFEEIRMMKPDEE